MALEALGAVDHRAAGVLEALCPRDVVRLVEAGSQLHEDGDVLAVLGGRDEALAQVAALGDAVEGDLDLDAGVVCRGLSKQRQQRRHRLVRVGKKDVVVLDLLAHGPAVDDHAGGLGLEGVKDDLGAVEVGDAALEPVDVAEVERAVDLENAARLQAELVSHEGLEFLPERALDLKANRLEALAELEYLLHVLAVVLLFLDALAVRVDVGVARHAEHRGLLGPEVPEARAEAGPDHVLDEGVSEGLARGGELDHAVLGRRHLDDAQKAGLGRARERAGDEEPAAAQVGEGVARVDDERAHDGGEALVKEPLDRREVLVGVVGGPHAHQALLCELALDERNGALMALDERRQGGKDGVQLLGRSLVRLVVLGLVLEGGEVGKAAHADHEPLVEVRVEDLAELEALKEGHLLVECLVEHAVVETKPADLTVLGVPEVAPGLGVLRLRSLCRLVCLVGFILGHAGLLVSRFC